MLRSVGDHSNLVKKMKAPGNLNACEKAIRKLRRAIVVLPNDQSLKLELAGTIRLEAYLRNRALGSSSHDQNIGRPGNPEPDEPEPARSPK